MNKTSLPKTIAGDATCALLTLAIMLACVCWSCAAPVKGKLKRPGDMVARFDGDEFVALLPDTHEEGATRVAEKVRDSILALEIEHGFSLASECVTVSLGVATVLDAQNETPENLTRRAVQAANQARAAGGNSTHTA